MKIQNIYTFSFFLFFLSACSIDKIPGVYRIDIQQGNDITQEMINQLKPDMSKNQVAYILGTPLIIDTFHPNRWDYLYRMHSKHGTDQQRRITIFFKDDRLSHIEGDMRLIARQDLPEIKQVTRDIKVPLSDPETGLINDVRKKIGLTEVVTPDETRHSVEKPIPQPEVGEPSILERITP